MPRYFGIIAAIALMIVLIRKKVKMGMAMLAGAVLLAIVGKMYPMDIAAAAWRTFLDPETIRLMLVVISITAFGTILSETGSFEEIISNLKYLINDMRILISIIPALVGLLSVPGGAIMSAPLIGQIGEEYDLDRDLLAIVNTIFRHVNIFIFPFHSGLLLMSSVTNIDVVEFIKFNIPLTLVILPLAFFYLFRKIKPKKSGRGKISRQSIISLFNSLIPFIIVLALGLVFRVYFPLAVLTGILYVILVPKQKPNNDYIGIIKGRVLMSIKGIKWDMVLAVAGIMFFKSIVIATGFLEEISLILVEAGVPLLFLAIVFPLVTGLLTGNHSATIGLSVPLLLYLVPVDESRVLYFNLIYILSAASYLSSPLHLCTVLTTEYYKASFPYVLKHVCYISSWIIIAALIQFIILL